MSLTGSNYFFNNDYKTKSIGAYSARIANPNVTWETSEQTSIGFDANSFSNKLQLSLDWYNKVTKGWLVQAPVLATYGANAPYINGGSISNKGYEIMLKWNDKFNEINYNISISFAHNENEVTAINNDEGIIHGQPNVLLQGQGEMYRAQVGHPIGYFWGKKTNGIIQNAQDSTAYYKYNKDVRTGDIRFVDQNGDEVIDDKDNVMLGNPHPINTLGIQLNADYKGFNFMCTAAGAFGSQIAKSYHGFSGNSNFMQEDFKRWHGEGTSNTMPRLTYGLTKNDQYFSDAFIENGDYLKISNITIGYNFAKLFSNLPTKDARLYFTIKNCITFTKYSGMDPEVSYGPDSWSSGIDLGLYPASKSYMFGLSIKF